MAVEMEVKGLDGLIDDLKKMDELTGQMAEDMLDAGAEVLKETWKRVVKQRGHVKTGAMLKSVKVKKKADADVPTRVVYPAGKDKHGVSNAEKAFVIHYGKKNQKGDHFVDQIEEDAAEPVVAAMTRVRDQYIKGGR